MLSPNDENVRMPLGKVVIQVEMNNSEARSDLRAMLEYQIREKEKRREQDSTAREKIY